MLVVAVAPETTFSLAARASDRDRVLERLHLETSSTLTGLAMRDILVTFPADKIFLEQFKEYKKETIKFLQASGTTKNIFS